MLIDLVFNIFSCVYQLIDICLCNNPVPHCLSDQMEFEAAQKIEAAQKNGTCATKLWWLHGQIYFEWAVFRSVCDNKNNNNKWSSSTPSRQVTEQQNEEIHYLGERNHMTCDFIHS